MSALHSIAEAIGYLVLALLALWGLFLIAVGAYHVLFVERRTSGPGTGLSVVRSAPAGESHQVHDGSDSPAPLFPIGGARW